MKLKFDINIEQKGGSQIGTKEAVIARKFNDWIIKKGVNVKDLDSEEKIKELILKSHTLMPGVKPEDVIANLKESEILSEVKEQKIIKPKKPEKVFKTESEILPGITEIEDKEIKRILAENKFFEELEKDVLKSEEMDDILEKSYSLLGIEESENQTETIEYYNEFAEAGLIKGGLKEIQDNFKKLKDRIKLFEEEKNKLTREEINRVENNKKIATIIENAVAYGVSDLEWYGDNVSLKKTSQFDDVKRRIDGVLEVRKEEYENSFMGLGIDVTYRGLLSESYKEKFRGLLESIKNGHKTKIKYFKNHEGEMMREFPIPKIVLFFNIDDVKELVYMIKNIDNPKVKEEFKNSPQKFTVMNQIMIQCELLADFAEKSRNTIFKKYIEVVSSIKELAWDNPELKRIIDARHEDEVSKHIKYLIDKFDKQ